MNPTGESSQPPPPTAATAEPNVGTSPNPLAGLENAVTDAANQAAAAQAIPTPAQTPAETQFTTQFGSEQTTPPAEPAPDLMGQALAGLETPSAPAVPESKPEDQNSSPVAQLDPSIKTVDDLLTKGPQVVDNPNPTAEAVMSSEQTPAEKWQKISDDVKAFLDEVTREKVAA